MRTRDPVTIRRADYVPPAWRVPRTRLRFELAPGATRVTATLSLERAGEGPLVLDGTDAAGKGPLALESIALDGAPLGADAYARDAERLVIERLPDRCELSLVTVVDPDANTALEGLYRSGGTYCTQCEAEGFRKITYYPDRPDVLSVFDVSVEAPRDACPVLLSNGNLVGSEDLGDGRHLARWHDPHPKPCYLFALVAGDLAGIEERFTTMSGREVSLHVYTEAHNVGRCDFAMASLKAAMRWDETVYGLEYDLERFTIVAVDDFNMGAMENKGLNVFNTRYVLADAETATDADFLGVEAVVAHEYFHNWTGNRVTCRDWFQLSLKEGLTVFRDQSFTADRHSATVKRIEDVRLLRARQFVEDAGPMAHPIRPDSYIEINNFYTLTVYEKGAEVIRMLHTLIGPEAWRRGMDLYFERHDGTAATCDDFVDAMEAASGIDLARFRLWYSTAGTPEISVTERWDEAAGRYVLDVAQRVPDTPGQSDKPPLHVPLRLGLLDADGRDVPLDVGRPDGTGGTVLDLTEREQSFVFDGLPARPVPSLLRGFSAPVRLRHAADDATLAFLMAHDSDLFNRWEAGQRLATRLVGERLDGSPASPSDAAIRRWRVRFDEAAADAPADAPADDGSGAAARSSGASAWIEALGAALDDEALDPAFRAEMLSPPSLETLAETREPIDVHAIERVRDALRAALARQLRERLEVLASTPSRPIDPTDHRAIGERRLANTALALLGALEPEVWLPVARRRYVEARNMSDRVAGLALLCDADHAAREEALADFHARWRELRLVVDKWFAVQATSRRAGVIDDVEALLDHPDFTLANPNRVRALLGGFASGNPARFHRDDGRGYRLIAEHVVRLDRKNPQTAARLLAPLLGWRRHAARHALPMREALERVSAAGELSPDVFELVVKSLEEPS